MQLSVTNPSTDPNLAPFLGNFSPAAVGPEATPGAAPLIEGFAQLLAQTVPTNPETHPAETSANVSSTSAELLARESSGATPWAFAASSSPANLAATVSSAAALEAQPQHSPAITGNGTVPLPGAATPRGEGAARGIVSLSTAKSDARGATATASNESESADGLPQRRKAANEIPGEAIAPAASAAIGSTIASAPAPETAVATNESLASAAQSSVESHVEARAKKRERSGAPAENEVPSGIARAESLLAKASRAPFRGVTASLPSAENTDLSESGSSVVETSRGADTMSSVANDGRPLGSASPFERDLPSRSLAEWPLTAQPKAQSAESTESADPKLELPVAARESGASPFSVPAIRSAFTSPSSANLPMPPHTQASATSAATSVACASSGTETVSADASTPALPSAVHTPIYRAPLLDASGATLSTGIPKSLPAPNTAGGAAGMSAARGQTMLPTEAEKFAALGRADRPSDGVLPKASAKSFVATESKKLTEQPLTLGTAVAKPADAMFSAPTLPLAVDATHDAVTWAVAPSGEASAEVSAEMPATPEVLSTAHRAVEAVLTAVHRFSSRDQHAVNLQFTVGGADLSVRVEMRADEVRATFTTDSVELRAALAHEWQASQSAPSGDRPVRLANPVFASGDAANFGAAGDQNGSRHRQAQTPSQTSEPFTLAGLRSRAARAAAFEASVPVVAPVISRAPLSTALHLHTLA